MNEYVITYWQEQLIGDLLADHQIYACMLSSKYAKNDAQRKLIQRVSDLYALGEKATKEDFKAAAYAAYAAYAAADADAYAYAYARNKARSTQAKKLIELLKAAQ